MFSFFFFSVRNHVTRIFMKIVIVVYCLYLKLGISSLIGSMVTIIVMLPLQFIVGRALSRNSENGAVRRKWNSYINFLCMYIPLWFHAIVHVEQFYTWWDVRDGNVFLDWHFFVESMTHGCHFFKELFYEIPQGIVSKSSWTNDNFLENK